MAGPQPPRAAGFEEFFRRATGGPDPFPYQCRFALSETLPLLLHVPTGAGKTAAAILGWLWRRRFAAPAIRARTPRRLVYCLPMRVLVEQTRENARHWLKNLDLLADGPGDARRAGDGGWRIAVSVLMGGEGADDWDVHPERDAVLVGTQDMLLSRALNRGYGMSRYRWPMHFALLNNDCLWVMDEVQLMGAGLPTTAQLEAFRAADGGFGTFGPARSLWMSATPGIDALTTVDFAGRVPALLEGAVGLGPEDLAHPTLSKRLNARKPLLRAETVLAKAVDKEYARRLAGEVRAAHRPGTLSLVVVNRVARAQAVYEALRQSGADAGAASPELLLIHSRFRPHERRALERRLQEVDRLPPAGGCIVVATQAIEAGVDVSARLLVTELAPWTSLVQRFGRCNRRGEWGEDDPVRVFWVDFAGLDGKGDVASPYDPAALLGARERLLGLEDAGPGAVAGIGDPAPAPPSQVLRRRDLIDLFDTTPDLAGADIDVSPFVRDAEDSDVQVFWRHWEGDAPPADLAPPRPDELCAVSLPAARNFLKNAAAHRWDGLEGEWVPVRAGERLRPGLTLLLNPAAGGYDAALGWTGVAGLVTPVPAPPAESRAADANDADPETFSGFRLRISEHADDAVREMEGLALALADLPGVPWHDLLSAARWHDAGKAHPAFQNALDPDADGDGLARHDGPWAKSGDPRRRLRHGVWVDGRFQERRHFRHELASALLTLRYGGGDLAAYLVAAHHGKVRLSLRSLPGEAMPPGGRRFARGVWEGDTVPGFDLGGGIAVPETRLGLGLMELGESEEGPSWLERTLALRDAFGPFRLAWLETLVRVADWRATRAVARPERREVMPHA